MSVAETQEMPAARHYDLGPSQLVVEAVDGSLLDGFEYLLGDRGRPAAAAPTFSITIRTGEPEALPADAELLYRGPLLDEGVCEFARMGQTHFISFPGEARMVVDPGARRAEIVVSPDHRVRAFGSLVPIAVEFALDMEDQQAVHAAGLALPGGKGMVVISAPSGTGKTTTALALARCGLPFAADDVMVLRRAGGEGRAAIVAWGLPRALNVHRDTAAMLPWLDLEPQWNQNGEQNVPRRRLAEKLALEDGELPVTRLVLLRRGDRAAVEPLDATEMLAALAADNVRASAAGLTPLQARRFAMLADLVRTVPACLVTVPDGLSAVVEIAERLRG